ncbi:hypothetical protein [Deinococcus radiotolerans]|uniref:DUF2207 domain-containing protein n=1 Tax=Deinococcus radiotolerans TaxID=1309407 RepID=A0ABQ2FMH7_9DEIO|nr:hypothetical protein [Deinococcus radiotolerans]GGL04246.1 hypothetical protein GCM10010844_23620 [Deinococcus radiotolerans]
MTRSRPHRRGGARLARQLLRAPSPDQQDPWLARSPADPRAALSRGRAQVRRLSRVGLLVILTLTALSFLGTLALLLGIGVASGSDVAGWLLGLTLLLSFTLIGWSVHRARHLLRAPTPEALPAAAPPDEQDLLRTLRLSERALPTPSLPAFQRAVTATRDALRATEHAPTLTRDVFDARQAAREDLPRILDAYQRAPHARDEQELHRQLHLIETRMADITRMHSEAQRRDQQADTTYLRDKYDPPRD